jgi:flavin reductase (DIM6/NTAB) family NADH-FMN oxidoreductase RutF
MMEEQGFEAAFEQLVGRLDYPMFIVTTRAGEEMAGCLVGFASQCSIDPPRFLVCLSEKNRTCAVASGAEALAIHFVPASATDLAELFGGETGDEVDKFARCEWLEGPRGLPVLTACENWLVGEIVDRRTLGDHIGFLLAPVDAHASPDFDEFSFHRARRLEPGHEP